MMPSVHGAIAVTLVAVLHKRRGAKYWLPPLNFALHFVEDAIPHFEPDAMGWKLKKFLGPAQIWAALDILAMFYILWVAIKALPECKNIFIWSSLAAFGPDVVQTYGSMFVRPDGGLLTRYIEFHHWIHFVIKGGWSKMTSLIVGIVDSVCLYWVAWKYWPKSDPDAISSTTVFRISAKTA